jgi:RNA polymerase sigma-70 factor (ECF subfamily)
LSEPTDGSAGVTRARRSATRRSNEILVDDLDTLVAAARGGDHHAWERLYRRSYPRLLAYARRRLPTEESARDVVAEAMARAVVSVDRLREGSSKFDAWMYGILRHVVLDAQRDLSRQGAGPVPDGPDSSPQPQDIAVMRNDAVALWAAFRRLRPEDQEVLELRVVAGLSADEVAEVLGRRAGAVRMAQHRALARLRRILEEEESSADTG